MRRRNIHPHKSLRYLRFRVAGFVQGLALTALVDVFFVWQMSRILEWHSRLVRSLLGFASVPWQLGRKLALLPGTSVILLHTNYLDYRAHPLFPGCFACASLACFCIGYRKWSAPLKPLLFLVPAGLGITFLYLEFISPAVPYTPEGFCAIWYRGEAYLWLVLPLIFAMSFFILNVPLSMKFTWLFLLLVYSFLWSAVRLALALATFHYFGSIWMPFFYFAFGFLADFLYIVAFYSMALDRAAAFLAKQEEAWA